MSPKPQYTPTFNLDPAPTLTTLWDAIDTTLTLMLHQPHFAKGHGGYNSDTLAALATLERSLPQKKQFKYVLAAIRWIAEQSTAKGSEEVDVYVKGVVMHLKGDPKFDDLIQGRQDFYYSTDLLKPTFKSIASLAPSQPPETQTSQSSRSSCWRIPFRSTTKPDQSELPNSSRSSRTSAWWDRFTTSVRTSRRTRSSRAAQLPGPSSLMQGDPKNWDGESTVNFQDRTFS